MTVIDPSLDKGRSLSANHWNGEASTSLDVAMVAHDLRCALQGVTGGVAVLEKAVIDPDLRDQLTRVFEAAEAVSVLVNLLLPGGGEVARTGGVVDVGGFVEHLRRRWAAEARLKGLRLVLDAGAAKNRALRVDGLLLERVIGNLLCNAIRHTETGSVTLVAAYEPTRGLSFHLRDEGPGIDPAVLERAEAAGHRPAEGEHGLGLRIARSLTGKLGAELLLRNRGGGGFEAWLSFPSRLCVETAAPAARTAERAEHDLTGVRILLAEDNPTNQMVATQMLTALKAEVTIASDGVEALEFFERGAFDLVVVDIEMPRMSGLDVIRSIRARPDPRSTTPIVALTAYAMREHQDRIARAGANGLISKPISSIEALGRALGAHVAAGRAGAAPAAAAPETVSPIVDLAIFDALRQAIGPDMMAELMEKVVADLLAARADLTAAEKPLSRDPIRSASHILISVAGAVGVTRLQGAARELNTAAHGENSDGLVDKLRHCLDELDHAIAFARGQLVER
ncbi:MAG: response regulator [Amaricoccus sp.]|uniref:response regulator n=1 Tax=Amaricoccus sp. TaxID=1872485 RepID=UPI0033156AFE